MKGSMTSTNVNAQKFTLSAAPTAHPINIDKMDVFSEEELSLSSLELMKSKEDKDPSLTAMMPEDVTLSRYSYSIICNLDTQGNVKEVLISKPT